MTVKDITLIALLAVILFVQEEALSFIPNVQFTVFLLILYAKKLGFFKTCFIILIYVILDNLAMGSLNFIFMPFMFIGWILIPIIVCTFFKKTENPLPLAFIGVICSFAYCWIYMIPACYIGKIDPVAYFTADILWELILAACSFLSVLWLYKPCADIFVKIATTK